MHGNHADPGQGTSTLLQIGTTVWFKPSDQMWKWMAYDIPAAARRHLEGNTSKHPTCRPT
jgi:hypothetical protein